MPPSSQYRPHWSLRGSLLRGFYRILAPRHPRGWLDFLAFDDDRDPSRFSAVRCYGMSRWRLSDLEIVDVPCDLGGYAHGIMFDIVGYMRRERPIKADETLGGALVSEDQLALHFCSFRAVRRDDDPRVQDFLQVVDRGEPAASGFPRRLFAAHLIALADKTRRVGKQIEMLRRAVEIHPGESGSGAADDAAVVENPGNFFGWLGLGDALCGDAQHDEGLECLRTAVDHWRHGGREHARAIVAAIGAGRLPGPDHDARARFWTDVAAGM